MTETDLQTCGQFPVMNGMAVIDVTLSPDDTNAATTDSWVRAVESAAAYAKRHGWQRTADRSQRAAMAYATSPVTRLTEHWHVIVAVERQAEIIGTALEHSIEDPFTKETSVKVQLRTDGPGATEVTT